MDLRYGFGIVFYYSMLILFFIGLNGFGSDYNVEINSTTNVNFNNSEISDDEIDNVGFWSTGIDFGRFLDYATFTVFLPSNSADWFVEIFKIWQGLINLIVLMWLFASLWNG